MGDFVFEYGNDRMPISPIEESAGEGNTSGILIPVPQCRVNVIIDHQIGRAQLLKLRTVALESFPLI